MALHGPLPGDKPEKDELRQRNNALNQQQNNNAAAQAEQEQLNTDQGQAVASVQREQELQ